MSCHCKSPFEDCVTAGVKMISVNAILTPTTDYLWEVRDRQGNVYFSAFTTDENGKGQLDPADLPDGFLNSAIGAFAVRVKKTSDGCDYEKMIMAVTYDALSIDVIDSNLPKSKVGCEVSFPVSPTLSAKSERFTITDQTAGPTFEISEATSSLLVTRNGVVDEEVDFDPGSHTWTFTNPLTADEVVRFIYNRS